LAGTSSLEIEIHSLFQEGGSIDYVCRELVSKYERNETLSSYEIEGLGHFLITAGRFDLLQSLLIKSIKRSKLAQFPVGLAVEAMRAQDQELSYNDFIFFNSLIEFQPDESTALQSESVQSFSLTINKKLATYKKKWQADRLQLKTKLIEQLNEHRIYQLQEQEDRTLNHLVKFFPQDIEIGLLKQAHLERKADDILSRVISQKNLAKPKNPSSTSALGVSKESQEFIADVEKKLRNLIPTLSTQSPDQLYNFAILAFQFEMYELVLEILSHAPETESRDWLRAEALAECGRFLDLLKTLENLEKKASTNVEATFGATYLRALAYYGLGQKDYAIALLESLAARVPSYRSTEALLHEWRNS